MGYIKDELEGKKRESVSILYLFWRITATHDGDKEKKEEKKDSGDKHFIDIDVAGRGLLTPQVNK